MVCFWCLYHTWWWCGYEMDHCSNMKWTTVATHQDEARSDGFPIFFISSAAFSQRSLLITGGWTVFVGHCLFLSLSWSYLEYVYRSRRVKQGWIRLLRIVIMDGRRPIWQLYRLPCSTGVWLYIWSVVQHIPYKVFTVHENERDIWGLLMASKQ